MILFKLKNLCIFLCIILSSELFFAQETEGFAIPNFTPPSPEAYQMTKYGDLPIDEFNGKVQANIPLYEYVAGQLKLPISLNYYGAGVKVNDIPTQVGINWTLEAGGIITRELRDLPDEFGKVNNTRFNLTDQEITNLVKPDCTSESAQLREYFVNDNYDTEVDIFRFHFLNYTGSFYFDGNFQPKLIKNEYHLKIEVQGELFYDKTIIITDTSGIKYYFGGAVCESTSLRSLNYGGITSFYLYQIQHPINGTIIFEYDTLDNYAINLSKQHTTTRYLAADQNYEDCSEGVFSDSNSYSLIRNNIIHNRVLKRIYNMSNNEFIIFNRTLLNNESFKTVLNNIEIRKGFISNSYLKSKVNLTYSGLENVTNAKRFFLTEVLINKGLQYPNETRKKYEQYRMLYNDPNALPARLSRDVDMLGYYNNAGNTTLTPCFPNPDGTYASNCPDRDANFFYSSKGTLKRLYYPTGGYTEFEYEAQPSYRQETGNWGWMLSLNPTVIQPAEIHQQIPGNYTDENGIVQTIVMPKLNGRHQITLSANTFGNIQNKNAQVTIKITDSSGGEIIRNTTLPSYEFSYIFSQNKTYSISFKITPPTQTIATYEGATGSFSISDVPQAVSIGAAGVRVLRVKNFQDENNLSSIKRYYYKAYDKLNSIESDQFEFIPLKTSSAYITTCFRIEDVMEVSVQTTSIHSDYNYSDFCSSMITYRDFTNVSVSYGGDNFEQGGIEKTFKASEKSTYVQLKSVTPGLLNEFYINTNPEAKGNAFSLDGTLVKEKTFKNINGTIYKVLEKQFGYEYPAVASKTNLFGSKLYSPIRYSYPCNDGNTISNFFIGAYSTTSYDFKKTSEKETLYIDPVPATLVAHNHEESGDPNVTYPTQEELESTYKKITTSRSYEYGSLKGLPTVITEETSQVGVSKIQKNYYVNDASIIGGLNPAQIAACNKLLSQNNIAKPIQVEEYQNSQLLGKRRTTYKVWNSNPEAVLPEFVQSAKGVTFEDRVVFTEYDDSGNPSIVSMKNGTLTKYIYNINNQVRLKIENYLPSDPPITFPAESEDCSLINLYPKSMVTVYNYDENTNQIISVVAPDCQKTHYVYDEMHKLKYIKDHNQNIIQEFINNYKP